MNGIILQLLIIAIVAVLGFFIIEKMGLPDPIGWILKLILGVALIVALLHFLPFSIL